MCVFIKVINILEICNVNPIISYVKIKVNLASKSKINILSKRRHKQGHIHSLVKTAYKLELANAISCELFVLLYTLSDSALVTVCLFLFRHKYQIFEKPT